MNASNEIVAIVPIAAILKRAQDFAMTREEGDGYAGKVSEEVKSSRH
jgi:hypothetical protein